MRRFKFVELVSAYLDGEISEQEMELLREEVRKNPERRALLASYKRMNKAASMADFPAEESVAEAKRWNPFGSTFVWCASGSFAGVAIALVFMTYTGNGIKGPEADSAEAYAVVSEDLTVTGNASKPEIDASFVPISSHDEINAVYSDFRQLFTRVQLTQKASSLCSKRSVAGFHTTAGAAVVPVSYFPAESQ